MAEVIGIVASAATLAQIVSVSSKFLHRVSGIPRETSQVSQEILQLSSQLQLLQSFQENPTGDDVNLSNVFQRSLEQARQSIEKVQTALIKLEAKSDSTRGKLRWILLGKEEASSLLNELSTVRAALNTTLNLALCFHHNHQTNATNKILAFLENTRTRASLPQASRAPKPSFSDAWDLQAEMEGVFLDGLSKTTRAVEGEFNVPGLGCLAGSLTSISEDSQLHTYSISLMLELPLRRALALNLLIRTYSNSWLSFRILRSSSITVSNLVQEESPFMVACRRGDVPSMHHLLYQRMASPHDMTIAGLTPMSAAIESGNAEAVMVLLRAGADANGLFGRKQTSPLAWALLHRYYRIVRLLLSHDASSLHITSYGWTPLFYLWCEQEGEDSARSEPTDILPLLVAKPDFTLSHAGIFDIYGTSVIHQAVRFGTAEDIALLIRMGVSIFTSTGPLQWTAIHRAVYFGKVEIFRLLLPYYRHLGTSVPDTRGWTLLHIAASEGHATIVEDLLRLGADWQVPSTPAFLHMSETLFGGCWTPSEVAQAEGYERKRLFLRTVGRVLGESVLSIEELEEVQDQWVDAAENVSELGV